MLTQRVNKWLRIACGLGLLLLLVVQQKLCPWLVNPPPEPGQRTTEPTALPLGESRLPQKHAATRLPFLLPGSPPSSPRWPTAWNQIALRHTMGWRDGVVASGAFRAARDTNDTHVSDQHAAWYVWRLPRPTDTQFTPAGPQVVHATTDPTLRTSISRTGPPAV